MLIAIKLDGSSHTFYCHQGILQHRAKRLYESRNYHNSATCPSLHVPDVSARTISIFLVWLYTRQLMRPRDDDALPAEDHAASLADELCTGAKQRLYVEDIEYPHPEGYYMEDLDLVELAILAERYSIPALAVAALRELVQSGWSHGRSTTADAVNSAYAELPHGSFLIRFLIEDAHVNLFGKSFPASSSAFCTQYIADVLEQISLPRDHGTLFLHVGRTWEYQYYTLTTCSNDVRRWSAPEYRWKFFPCPSSGLMGSQMCTILVGPRKQSFSVHRGYLCFHSKYFNTALTGGFIEATSGILSLDNESVRTFNHFLLWMYEGRVRIPPKRPHVHIGGDAQPSCHGRIQVGVERMHDPGKPEASNDDPETKETQDEREWVRRNLIELYIFADRRHIPALRNDIITKIVTDSEDRDETGHGWPATDPRHVRLALDNLPASSTLVRYLVAEVWFSKDEERAALVKSPLPSFVEGDLSATPSRWCWGTIRHGLSYAPWREDLCAFYEHDDHARSSAKECKHGQANLEGALQWKATYPEGYRLLINSPRRPLQHKEQTVRLCTAWLWRD
ncbi:hypothetical protein LTR85_010334 [Meristemomyces frigidus]|nr:hypothetical protein LTR85_010334 [Meristemomyces frigidus]